MCDVVWKGGLCGVREGREEGGGEVKLSHGQTLGATDNFLQRTNAYNHSPTRLRDTVNAPEATRNATRVCPSLLFLGPVLERLRATESRQDNGAG